ncbi:MAG: LamG domain-containing protein, partial [Candidatus Omnitrophica bacterium]|nr:LamG domain-containing protein [Candidatus Omnitrophota bacterium]
MKAMPTFSVLAALSLIIPASSPVQVKADYQTEVLADGPLVYYPFNETSGFTAVNKGSLGAAANGTYPEIGVLLDQDSAASALGKAINLDGDFGYVAVPALSSAPLTNMTVEMWLDRTIEVSGLAALYAAEGWNVGDLHLNLASGATTLLEFAVNGNSADPSYPRFAPNWPLDEWHHLAVTYEGGGQVKVYLDGALVGQQSAGGATPLQFHG